MTEITTFWENIWAKPVHFENHEWLEEEQQMPDTIKHKISDITEQDVSKALAKTQKWKTPGEDKVPNFWLHHLKCAHRFLAKALNQIIDNPEKITEMADKWRHISNCKK